MKQPTHTIPSREEILGHPIFDFIADSRESVAARAQETLGNVVSTTKGRRQYRHKDFRAAGAFAIKNGTAYLFSDGKLRRITW